MCKDADPLLLMGRILVDEGLISDEELQTAILCQVGHRALRWPGRKLGEHLVAQNLASRPRLETALAARDSRNASPEDMLLGTIAVRNGFLSGEELTDCLMHQEAERAEGREPLPLGKLILANKLMTEQELQALIDRQHAVIAAADAMPACEETEEGEPDTAAPLDSTSDILVDAAGGT